MPPAFGCPAGIVNNEARIVMALVPIPLVAQSLGGNSTHCDYGPKPATADSADHRYPTFEKYTMLSGVAVHRTETIYLP